jgi:hypothetical protein
MPGRSSPLPAEPAPSASALVFWTLWVVMNSGLVVLRVVIPSPRRDPAAAAAGWGPVEFVALGAFFAALLVRWVLLPRFDTLQKKLPVFIVACALAESCAILGIFVAPAHGRELFVLGLAALASMVPLFALPRAESFPRTK